MNSRYNSSDIGISPVRIETNRWFGWYLKTTTRHSMPCMQGSTAVEQSPPIWWVRHQAVLIGSHFATQTFGTFN